MMHCFICFIGTVALLTVTSAAGIRPILSIPSRSDDLALSAPLRRGYQEQDTARAFYSYGYSDENAARAEYTTRDGSSRGFYSYVDANGKLQTVKYEAGGVQGFKAEASNQPKAPVDDKKPPMPVTDTLEVQQAREAHLNALKEAQDEARREEMQQQQEQEQEKSSKEKPLSDEDADILERVRAELTSMLADRQREESRLSEEDIRKEEPSQNEENDQSQDDDDQREQEQKEEKRQAAQDQRLQTANDAKDLRLRTVYTLADISSSSYLKLSDLEDRLDRNNQELRIPIGAYYSYVSPNAKFSVTTPTELRTLRPVALSRSLLLSKQNQNGN